MERRRHRREARGKAAEGVPPAPRPMYRLPLFPLPVVLFPTAALPLHVFEERYKRMVDHCRARDGRFGLVYHDPDVRGPFLIEPGRVGCVAEIKTLQRLPDGRSMLLARGIERFRIEDGVESGEPFYEAVVSDYPDQRSSWDLSARRAESLALFEAVIETLPAEPERLPELDVARELSFPLARTIEVEPTWQQSFMELRREASRLAELDRVFRAALD